MHVRIKPYSCSIIEMANKNHRLNCNTSHVTEHYTKYSPGNRTFKYIL